MFKSDGMRQDHNGQLYMSLIDESTMREVRLDIPPVVPPRDFDLRPASGHLWRAAPSGLVAEPCSHDDCKACGNSFTH